MRLKTLAILGIAALFVIQAEVKADAVGIAMRYQGLNEHSSRLSLKKVIGVDPVRTPWCGAFLGKIMQLAGRNPPKNYTLASSWRTWGRSVAPRRGAVAIFNHSHVGLVVSVSKGCVNVVSGNDTDSVRARCRNPRTIKDYRG